MTQNLNPTTQNLNATVNQYIASGWRVESSTPGQVVLVKGKPVNHILHLLLSLLLLGLWLIVWLILVVTQKQERIILTEDPATGHVLQVRA